jgi:hypothetical protein
VLGEDQRVRAAALAALRRCTVVLSCAAVAGCLPMVERADTPDESRPQAGQCYDTPDAVLADAHDPTPPVACSEPHTLETYAVLEADGPLNRRTLAALDRRCVQRIHGFLGDDNFMQTAVSVYYFTPTRAQQADGARWVRCDAGVVTDTAVSGARRVTGSLRDAFEGGVPTAYRRCLNSAPDPATPQPLVPCGLPHVAEQMPTGIDLGGPADPYVGQRRLVARAQPRCAVIVSQALPDAARSLVVVPTALMWRSGITTAQCWALAPPGRRLNESEAQPA